LIIDLVSLRIVQISITFSIPWFSPCFQTLSVVNMMTRIKQIATHYALIPGIDSRYMRQPLSQTPWAGMKSRLPFCGMKSRLHFCGVKRSQPSTGNCHFQVK